MQNKNGIKYRHLYGIDGTTKTEVQDAKIPKRWR